MNLTTKQKTRLIQSIILVVAGIYAVIVSNWIVGIILIVTGILIFLIQLLIDMYDKVQEKSAQKLKINKYERILRSRRFWIYAPLLLTYMIVAIIVGSKDKDWLFLWLPIGFFFLPAGFLHGSGLYKLSMSISDNIAWFIYILIYLLYYGGFIWFLIRLKRMNRKTLLRLGLLVLIIMIITIKGCATMNYSF